MPLQVVNLAQCQCTMGDAPTPLTVTSNTTVFVEKQLAATIKDFAPVANIKPFGTCKTLTAAASGVPTPCVPATTAPWAPGSATVLISKSPALRQSDTLACTVGGVISITKPGQTTVNVGG